MWKITFLVCNRVRIKFGEPGGTPPPRITRSTPGGGGGELSRDVSEKKLRAWPFLLLNSEHRSFVLYGKKYSWTSKRKCLNNSLFISRFLLGSIAISCQNPTFWLALLNFLHAFWYMMLSITCASDLFLWLQDMTLKERQVQSTPSSPGVSLENEMDKPRDLGTARLVKRLLSKYSIIEWYVSREEAQIKSLSPWWGVVTLMRIIHAIGHFSFVFSSISRSF